MVEELSGRRLLKKLTGTLDSVIDAEGRDKMWHLMSNGLEVHATFTAGCWKFLAILPRSREDGLKDKKERTQPFT